jgi:hypothetical protein
MIQICKFKNNCNSDELLCCTHCGNIYCEDCINESEENQQNNELERTKELECLNNKPCINLFYIETEVKKCQCSLYCRAEDVIECDLCCKSICCNCQYTIESQTNVVNYCKKCVKYCENCNEKTNYYFSNYYCESCGKILCSKCLIENLCLDCLSD